jgi:hypothetical protein
MATLVQTQYIFGGHYSYVLLVSTQTGLLQRAAAIKQLSLQIIRLGNNTQQNS